MVICYWSRRPHSCLRRSRHRPEEDWDRYQRELERQTGVTGNRVAFMERTCVVIRSYGKQSVMKVGLNQPIMREVLEKLMDFTESDGLTESVTKDSADENPIMKRQPVKRAKKGLKRLKGKVGSKTVNSELIKSKENTLVMSFPKASRPREIGQRDGAVASGGEKENSILPVLLAGLISTVLKSRTIERPLADTKIEREVTNQFGCGGLDDYKPLRTKMARV